MSISNEQGQLKSRMQNAQTVLGIILILGWILLLISIINEGFAGDTFIWVLAVLDGSLFWIFMRRFLASPAQVELKTLRTIFISFVVVWIIAVGVSFLVWGELYVETIFGIILFLVATFFMNQFYSDGKMYLMSLDKSELSGT